MPTIHWLGAGLSSVPGIRRLASAGYDLILWNRTFAKAEQALKGLESSANAQSLRWDDLSNQVQSGDVVVSMLPASMHIQVAEICLNQGANFVSSSYISPQMHGLDDSAKSKNLCLVNEVGLDPGIDHLMAHALVDEYRKSGKYNSAYQHFFRSYCGGFPKIPNEFKYKFSWSPLGVLKALTSPATWIANGKEQSTQQPWKSITDYKTKLPDGYETFQAYPNRDSRPFLAQYHFDSNWNVQEFVRGTLRLDGWAEAWTDIFELVENSTGEDSQQILQEKSEQLWNDFRYDNGESDRVVLSVELQVQDQSHQTVWHKAYCLDESGNAKGSAMARLVSLTTSIAVESVFNGDIEPGVSAAPDRIAIVNEWLGKLIELGERIENFDLVQ